MSIQGPVRLFTYNTKGMTGIESAIRTINLEYDSKVVKLPPLNLVQHTTNRDTINE